MQKLYVGFILKKRIDLMCIWVGCTIFYAMILYFSHLHVNFVQMLRKITMKDKQHGKST
jgi:hypothetical protein